MKTHKAVRIAAVALLLGVAACPPRPSSDLVAVSLTQNATTMGAVRLVVTGAPVSNVQSASYRLWHFEGQSSAIIVLRDTASATGPGDAATFCLATGKTVADYAVAVTGVAARNYDLLPTSSVSARLVEIGKCPASPPL